MPVGKSVFAAGACGNCIDRDLTAHCPCITMLLQRESGIVVHVEVQAGVQSAATRNHCVRYGTTVTDHHRAVQQPTTAPPSVTYQRCVCIAAALLARNTSTPCLHNCVYDVQLVAMAVGGVTTAERLAWGLHVPLRPCFAQVGCVPPR